MDIILYCSENGKYDIAENEFRRVKICSEDEKKIYDIVSNSLSKNHNMQRVHILNDSEYFELKKKAKNFDLYKEYNNREVLHKLKMENKLEIKRTKHEP